MSRRPGRRWTDFIARLFAKSWDQRVPAEQDSSADGRHGSRQAGRRLRRPRPVELSDFDIDYPERSMTASTAADSGARDTTRRAATARPDGEMTAPLTLERIEAMLTGPMGYGVRRHREEEHVCLLGTWDGFPFVIEIPEGHADWLLVSGDWDKPAAAGDRDELAASVNDWNRDKYFPTVALVDTPAGPLVRATYLVGMQPGITDAQLRLHLDTALSACTQALSQVRPLLPDL
ncbi:YbjN domain-containing protein [Actinomyces ruminicola]|uniref:Putative sensory transduction regulator n=1 Tax=Actinomyces ruminicola TaxID=332524 RepID=A0A1G9TXU7_9ACTO|nr:YbjN domain-containing protein [Actinomyces ruminicola]SDM52579.1 Putative sensory transduction regulator [Actinomyces ruminicola]